MTEVLQVTIDGMASGSIYAALALALVLIFRSTGLVNFAQGEMAMFSTYIAWQLTQSGVPVWGALALAVAVSFVGGVVIERTVIRRVEASSHLAVVIVTLGLFVGFNSLAAYIWSSLIKTMPDPFPQHTFDLGGVRVTANSIGTLVVLLAVVLVLYLLFQRTTIGLAMRAAAANAESARLVGVRVSSMLMLGWGLSAAVGALAGALAAPRLFLEPNLMVGVLIYAFAAATLGGFDSPLGAVVGGLVVGVTEELAGRYVGFIGSDLKILVPLLLIFAVLLLRPNGLFGRAAVVRA